MKLIQLDYFDWAEKFKPRTNPRTQNDTFETYGEDHDDVLKADNENPGTVWTLVDGGEECVIVDGYAYVNRLHYYLTEVPAEKDTTYEIEW